MAQLNSTQQDNKKKLQEKLVSDPIKLEKISRDFNQLHGVMKSMEIDASEKHLQKNADEVNESAKIVGQYLNDIPSSNQSVSIIAESILRRHMEELSSSQSESLSSCIIMNPEDEVKPQQVISKDANNNHNNNNDVSNNNNRHLNISRITNQCNVAPSEKGAKDEEDQ